MTNDEQNAIKLVRAAESERSARIARLESYVNGTQYRHLANWNTADCPIWDRAPCVIWSAPAGAISSNEDLLLGDGRYPTITSNPGEDSDDEGELGEEQSEALDAFVDKLSDATKLRARFRQLYAGAQGAGSCCAVVSIIKGKPDIKAVPVRRCEPKLDDDGSVLSLEIRYPYVGKTSKGESVALWYRRVIDAEWDTVYLPELIGRDGTLPDGWRVDATQTKQHGFGFCPVAWHAFRAEASIFASIDGTAIHEDCLGQLDAFNYEASTRHKGALHSLPQIVEIGVQPGYNPTGEPRGPSVPGKGGTEYTSQVAPKGSRKKGPGNVWQYSDPNAKVSQLLIPGDALQAIADTMTELRARVCEDLAWVPLNPEDVKYASSVSGKALEVLRSRQINRVAKDRDGFGDFMLDVLNLLLRVCQKLGPGAVKVPGLAKAMPILSSMATADGWQPAPLTLKWGEWFVPSAEDEKAVVESAIAAWEKGAITTLTLVERIARIFKIEDTTRYVEQLEEAAQKKSMGEHGALTDLLGKLHGDDYATPGRKPGGVRPKGAESGDSGDNRALDDALAQQGQVGAPSVFGG